MHRAYAAGGSRTIIDEVDDKSLMQTSKGNFMKGEARKDVEAPQNYGFTSVVMPADKGKDGQIEGSAEGFVSFMGGNRSFPVVGVMDDRRHRLKELEKGDSAMFRTKDDRQQFHMTTDQGEGDDKKVGGNFMSCRDDRIQRFALVPKPDDQQQQQSEAQPTATATAAGGGGGGGAGGQGTQQDQGKKKATGQKHALDDNRKSQIAYEQNGKENFTQHGDYYQSNRGGSDSSTYHQDRKHSTQCTDKHSHIRYEDHRIFNDEDGNWATTPILIKKDPHCKE